MAKKNNSRKNPAPFPQKKSEQTNSLIRSLQYREILAFCVVIFLLSFTVTLVGLSIKTYRTYVHGRTEIQESVQNLAYWEAVIKKHPEFPAAYLQAAKLAIYLDQTTKARTYLHKALELDPESIDAERLLKEME